MLPVGILLLCVLLFSVVGGQPAVPPLPLHPAAESSLSTSLFDWWRVAESHPILLSIRPRGQDEHAEQGPWPARTFPQYNTIIRHFVNVCKLVLNNAILLMLDQKQEVPRGIFPGNVHLNYLCMFLWKFSVITDRLFPRFCRTGTIRPTLYLFRVI